MAPSPDDWTTLGEPVSDFAKRAYALRPAPVFGGSPVELRNLIDPTESTPPVEGVREEDVEIPTQDGSLLRGKAYRPTGSKESVPLVILVHAGGFVVANHITNEGLARSFVKRFDCACLSVDYRTAPEHPFPTAVDDVWDTVRWAAEHAGNVGADLRKGFVLGGISAGANLALVAALQARDVGLAPPLSGLWLVGPWLSHEAVPDDLKSLCKSREQCRDAPMFSQSAIEYFMGHYKPDVDSEKFNPFNNPNGHGGLPPVYFQICGWDPLRDEALLYEKLLREKYGIKTRRDVYPGLPHVWFMRWPELEESIKEMEDLHCGIEWLLKQK